MGLSSSKTKTKTEQTVKPITPAYLENTAKTYNSMINNIAATDPQSFVAPESALQTMAYGKAGSLFGNDNGYADALSRAQAAGNTAVGPITATSYTAPQIGEAATVDTSAAMGQLYNPTTYTAADPGQAAQADMVQLKDYIDDYQNPYQQQVIDTTLASYDDQAGRTRAQVEAAAARNNAFGGSRYGIQLAQTDADLARERANLEATQRANMFNAAAALAGQDASARNTANMFNTGQTNEFGLARTGWENQARQFGADANNQFAMGRANIASQAAQQNAAAQNAAMLQQAMLDANAAQYGATNSQNANMFNANLAGSNADRSLNAAQIMAQIANSQGAMTNDQIALLAQLGNQQQQQDSLNRTAPISLAQTVGSLQAMTPYDILVGQQMNGTSTTKQSGSMLGGLLGIGSLAANFLPGKK